MSTNNEDKLVCGRTGAGGGHGGDELGEVAGLTEAPHPPAPQGVWGLPQET